MLKLALGHDSRKCLIIGSHPLFAVLCMLILLFKDMVVSPMYWVLQLQQFIKYIRFSKWQVICSLERLLVWYVFWLHSKESLKFCWVLGKSYILDDDNDKVLDSLAGSHWLTCWCRRASCIRRHVNCGITLSRICQSLRAISIIPTGSNLGRELSSPNFGTGWYRRSYKIYIQTKVLRCFFLFFLN